jgi:hypothetical protein
MKLRVDVKYSKLSLNIVDLSILRELSHYLVLRDCLSLFNSNKSLLYPLKRDVVRCQLSFEESLNYCVHGEVPVGLRNLIVDPSKQLGLLIDASCVDRRQYVILDFSRLRSVKKVTLKGSFQAVCGFEDLGTVSSLSLDLGNTILPSKLPQSFGNLDFFESNKSCYITDLTPLQRVPRISIQNTKSLVSTQPLSSKYQKYVNFFSCANLADVSSLRGIHTVILRNCTELKDISNLGNHFELDLSHCFKINDVSSLNNIFHLNLNSCSQIKDISSLSNVFHLNLKSLGGLRDLSGLKNVRSLNVSGCTGLQSLANYHLNKLTTISMFPKDKGNLLPETSNFESSLPRLKRISYDLAISSRRTSCISVMSNLCISVISDLPAEEYKRHASVASEASTVFPLIAWLYDPKEGHLEENFMMKDNARSGHPVIIIPSNEPNAATEHTSVVMKFRSLV